MTRAVEIAESGDVRASLDHERRIGPSGRSVMIPRLEALLALGPNARGWPFARWCVDQAYRWMIVEDHPRAADAVATVMCALHSPEFEARENDAAALSHLKAAVAGRDRMCRELAVFDFGGLADFLALRAEPGLLQRADRVQDWTEARMHPYVLRGASRGLIEVDDLATGRRIEVLDIGTMIDRPAGTYVMGRVVPIGEPPFQMFASRPVTVDEATAALFLEASKRWEWSVPLWLITLSVARQRGRLGPWDSAGQRISYVDDLQTARRD